MGDSPRKLSMWKDLITYLKRRLVIWKGVHLNIEGRICLINYVLNAIPIYSLSFYKAPSKILNKTRAVQSIFYGTGVISKSYSLGVLGYCL